MKSEWFFLFLGIVGMFLFIGLVIMLVNLNGHNYYQGQSYNNLPSLDKPKEIEHYEESRDALTFEREEVAQEGGNYTGILDLIYPWKKDGSVNWIGVFFIATFVWIFTRARRRSFIF